MRIVYIYIYIYVCVRIYIYMDGRNGYMKICVYAYRYVGRHRSSPEEGTCVHLPTPTSVKGRIRWIRIFLGQLATTGLRDSAKAYKDFI